jgi:hypothetical protein
VRAIILPGSGVALLCTQQSGLLCADVVKLVLSCSKKTFGVSHTEKFVGFIQQVLGNDIRICDRFSLRSVSFCDVTPRTFVTDVSEENSASYLGFESHGGE